ncbi:MAG: nucleotidyltransferase domain-containing protein [Planctomycetota bacterium]
MAGLNINPNLMSRFCKKWGVAKLSLFGSMLDGRATETSDVDVLVDFRPGSRVTYFDMARMERELQDVLGTARRVDLRTVRELSRHFRDDVASRAKVLYAA